MKFVLTIFLVTTLFTGCKKDEKLCCLPPEIGLMGKWVDANKREDTLEVYTEGNKGVLFDNSAYFRNNQSTIADPNVYKMQFQLKDGKIGVKMYSAPASAEYNYFDLTWIQHGVKFTMRQNAIRPYLSSIPLGTYERVQ
jgi:hypothetical protein